MKKKIIQQKKVMSADDYKKSVTDLRTKSFKFAKREK